MKIKTTEKIIESVHVKDTIYLDKMEYDRLRDVKWVRVDDVLSRIQKASDKLYELGVKDSTIYTELTIFYDELSQSTPSSPVFDNRSEGFVKLSSPDVSSGDGDKTLRKSPRILYSSGRDTLIEKDPDTCYEHNTYNIGRCCPECLKHKKVK